MSPRARRSAVVLGIIGLAGIIAAVIGGIGRGEAFFHAYLLAFIVWAAIPLGSITVVATNHVSGGRWALGVVPPARAAISTLPLIAAAIVPLLFGLRYVYGWARPEAVAADYALQWKRPYLNLPFFVVRAGVDFLLWTVLGLLLQRWSRRYEANPSPAMRTRLQGLAGGGLVLHSILTGFAAIDWIAALAKDWYSSVFGLQIFAGQALSALCMAALASGLAAPRRDAGSDETRGVRQDIGSLLLTLVVLFAYMAFSNGYVIWIGNLPHGISWFEPRVHGGWKAVGFALMVLQFGVPFWALMFRRIKRHPASFFAVVLVICAGRLLDQIWMVLPVAPAGAARWLLSLALVVGLGGLWVATFLWSWSRERRTSQEAA